MILIKVFPFRKQGVICQKEESKLNLHRRQNQEFYIEPTKRDTDL